jgi:hypothetical protein
MLNREISLAEQETTHMNEVATHEKNFVAQRDQTIVENE